MGIAFAPPILRTVESPPSPRPSKSELRSSRPRKRGEGGAVPPLQPKLTVRSEMTFFRIVIPLHLFV
jgi:hypothetical protein